MQTIDPGHCHAHRIYSGREPVHAFRVVSLSDVPSRRGDCDERIRWQKFRSKYLEERAWFLTIQIVRLPFMPCRLKHGRPGLERNAQPGRGGMTRFKEVMRGGGVLMQSQNEEYECHM